MKRRFSTGYGILVGVPVLALIVLVSVGERRYAAVAAEGVAAASGHGSFRVFPPASLDYLNALSQIGLLLLFTMMVIMALVTTIMTTPLLALFGSPVAKKGARKEDREALHGDLRR